MFQTLKGLARVEEVDTSLSSIIELSVASSSKGNQDKYYNTVTKEYIKCQFEYQGTVWEDYKVEALSSVIGSKLHTNVEVIQQREGIIKDTGKYCCISKDFCNSGEEWLPLGKIINVSKYSKNTGKSYKVFKDLLAEFERFNLDGTEYLIVMIVMDYLLGNEDRHYNNIGILRKYDGSYGIAPLFDFGLGLFEHDKKYFGLSLQRARSLMDGKPFSRDLQEPVNMLFNSGYGEIVYDTFKDVDTLDNKYFPTDLAYWYYHESLEYLKERMKCYEVSR